MKKFLIIGNMNATSYKEIFPLIKDNQLWVGDGKNLDFILFDGIIKGAASRWVTNLESNKKNEPLILTKKYDPALYPKYDNYDAINVDKVKDIPMDYDGVMGVPITFFDKYCPTQFEIIGLFNSYKPETSNIELGQIYGTPVKVATIKPLYRGPVVNGKCTYKRILIKKK